MIGWSRQIASRWAICRSSRRTRIGPGLATVGLIGVAQRTEIPVAIAELDAMTDQELVVGLQTDIVRPHFANLKLFQASAADRTCFRYRYHLPKLGGGRDQERTTLGQKLEKRFGEIRSTIEEALTLIARADDDRWAIRPSVSALKMNFLTL